jgi:hypothetical protein
VRADARPRGPWPRGHPPVGHRRAGSSPSSRKRRLTALAADDGALRAVPGIGDRTAAALAALLR